MIKNNCIYKITGKQDYFKNKYGTYNPIIKIEGTDLEYFGISWVQHHSYISMDFIDRLIAMDRLSDGLHKTVYYGKTIFEDQEKGEFVFEDEIEEIKK